MPKFALESAFSRSGALYLKGTPDAFDDGAANFPGMDGQLCEQKSDTCLLISDVLHKAFVSADEAGTETAAATEAIVGVTRALNLEQEPVEVVIGRPFLLIIRHHATGTILFMGRVMAP